MPELPWPLRALWLSRLAARSRRGDRDAFRDLYRALYGPVMRFVSRRVRRPADAEEITSQVFFRLLESLQQLDPRRNVLAYVLAIARNAIADHARASSGAEPDAAAALAPLAADDPGALARLEGAERSAALEAEWASLPAETRELLVMRFADGLRCGEIAELLGLTHAAVRQRLSRAVRELRARLNTRLSEGALTHDA